MKTKLRLLPIALMAASTLWLSTLPGSAQNTVISAAEFQRMVYSGQLLTVLDAKPELDASLQVLLELQRRNPNAAPAALADVTRQALQRYRTNAPAYIRTNGFRDEILAAYLDVLRQVPARTNFVPANLSLLNNLITRAPAPTGKPQADVFHSGSRLVLSGENDATERQALVDTCTARAQGNAAFAAAMDSLLFPTETPVSLADSPAAIIGSTNSALYGNYTMQTLLALSLGSGNGSLTVSSNQLINLFTNETQTLWTAIQTNLALQAELNQGQPDLLSYLTNQTALDADALRVAAVRQGQARTLASATAAVLIQSKLVAAGSSPPGTLAKLPKYMDGLSKIFKGVAGLTVGTPKKPLSFAAKAEGVLNIVSGGLSIFGLATDDPNQSPEAEIVREIGNVKTLIQDLSANQNYRFDRVDQSLVTIFDTLNTEFDKIEITLGAQGQQIAVLTDNVNNIRLSLLDVQTDLNRIERNLATFAALDWRYNLLEDMNLALGYEGRVGNPMDYQNLVPSFVGMENVFYTHAFNRATSETLSRYNTLPFSGADLSEQLSPGGATNVYAETLNYIKKHLRVTLALGASFAEPPILANPQDWNAGAGAWLQLAVENPTHFRHYFGATGRLDDIINNGRDLTNFFRSLTLTGSSGTNLNGPLYNALTNYYANSLPPFITQVQATEQAYAASNNFALNTWRQWSAAAPRVTATATELLIAPEPMAPILREAATRIAAGLFHSLALKSNGTVVAWGHNGNGQINVTPGLNNVVGVAAGGYHSLALKSNGLVVGWGYGGNGQTNSPTSASNVVAIAAGLLHSLALRADGRVLGWGDNSFGQTNTPVSATNVTAIAAGVNHNLALKTNGTVVGWGDNGSGQTNIPPSATNVMAIAAGNNFGLALRTNGTVVGWGDNGAGQTNIPPSATNVMAIAGGGSHGLALKANGTVIGWGANGSGQTKIPIGLTNVIAIVAGSTHSLALKADGTVVVWGAISLRQCVVPPALTWRGAIASGASHMLALKADGSLLAWGDNGAGQTNIPTGQNLLSNGGFELGITIGPGTFTNRTSYGAWTVSAGSVPLLGMPYVGMPAYEGIEALHVGNNFGAGAVRQSFATTLGQKYTLSLAVIGWSGGGGTVQATVFSGAQTNLVQNFVAPAINVWSNASYSFVATGASTTLQIQNIAGACTIDDVRVTTPSATNVVAIAAGDSHNLALKADGTVVGWGFGNFGQLNVPPGATNVVAIAAGARHSLALKADGTIIPWGQNSFRQGEIPVEATNVVAIAAGGNQSLALKANGTVVGWGRDNDDNPITSTPAGLANVVAIAVGGSSFYGASCLALKSDGTIVAWGNYNGGSWTNVPPGGTNVVAIAVGAVNLSLVNLALKSDSTVVSLNGGNSALATNAVAIAAGNGSSAVLRADGTVLEWSYGRLTIPAGLTSVKTITAGDYHSLALKADRTVVGWGYNDFGQLDIPAGLTNVEAIAAGDRHSLALKADGTVVGWGYNGSGQLDINGATNVVAIAAGPIHSLALKADGLVIGWGGTIVPDDATNAVAIAAGGNFDLALKADGKVIGWGYTAIPANATNVVSIAAGGVHGLALRADRTLVAWGDNSYNQTNIPPSATNVVAIAAGAYHSLALKADGKVIGWGDNTYGQINTTGLSNVVAIAAGAKYSLFLKSQTSSTAGQTLSLVRAQIPRRLGSFFQSVNVSLLANLQPFGSNSTNAFDLSGPKALLTAVLELGLPYTLERDDVLHGFLYGNESLVDLTTAQTFLQDENEKLQANPEAKPQSLVEVAVLRNQRFVERLNQRLLDLQATGQPEIPRLVGHTLRLLNLLRDSWNATPPSSLEIGSKTNGVGLVLYGEPYARYTLLQSSNLTSPANWISTAITDLRSADSPLGTVTTNLPITSDPARYYRAAQPVP